MRKSPTDDDLRNDLGRHAATAQSCDATREAATKLVTALRLTMIDLQMAPGYAAEPWLLGEVAKLVVTAADLVHRSEGLSVTLESHANWARQMIEDTNTELKDREARRVRNK